MSETQTCGKVLHTSEQSAEIQSDSLKYEYGLAPNIYVCKKCSRYFGQKIWHVGYGYMIKKMQRKHRRRKSEYTTHYRKKKRAARK